MKFKIYSIVFTLTIFVLVQMTSLQVPNIFENVLAQQQESSQQRSIDEQLRDQYRNPELEQRSSLDGSRQVNEDDVVRDLDDRRQEIEQRSSQGVSSQESEDDIRDDFDRRQNIE
jgi:predicted Holliday junction resolvase-like endonuclease